MFSRSPEWGMSDRVSSETLTELICFLAEQKQRCQETSTDKQPLAALAVGKPH